MYYFRFEPEIGFRVGTKELPIKDIAKIYPNPAINYINLELPALENSTSGQAKIYDINGAFVQSYEVNASGVIGLNIEALSSGFYIIEVQTEEFVYKGSFVKE